MPGFSDQEAIVLSDQTNIESSDIVIFRGVNSGVSTSNISLYFRGKHAVDSQLSAAFVE